MHRYDICWEYYTKSLKRKKLGIIRTYMESYLHKEVVWLDVSVKEEALTCLVYRFEARDKLDEDQKGCFKAELASTYVEHVFECRTE